MAKRYPQQENPRRKRLRMGATYELPMAFTITRASATEEDQVIRRIIFRVIHRLMHVVTSRQPIGYWNKPAADYKTDLIEPCDPSYWLPACFH
jgi:fructose-1,6-bisphosphatase